MAENHAKVKYHSKFFSLWKEVHTDTHISKLNNNNEETLSRELNELTAKYNKEIDMLQKRLEETTRALDEANQKTFDMQENLKKAFMRGVCALNFEAMSILQTKEGSDAGSNYDPFGQAESIANNMFNFTQKTSSNPQATLQNAMQNTYQNTSVTNFDNDSRADPDSPQKKIVFYQNPKVIEKMHCLIHLA